jgi:hypothetical protein
MYLCSSNADRHVAKHATRELLLKQSEEYDNDHIAASRVMPRCWRVTTKQPMALALSLHCLKGETSGGSDDRKVNAVSMTADDMGCTCKPRNE